MKRHPEQSLLATRFNFGGDVEEGCADQRATLDHADSPRLLQDEKASAPIVRNSHSDRRGQAADKRRQSQCGWWHSGRGVILLARRTSTAAENHEQSRYHNEEQSGLRRSHVLFLLRCVTRVRAISIR